MQVYELIIVGGGAAGILCAIEAKKAGIKNVLLIEKENILGGALCFGNYNISNGLKITGKFYRKYLIEEYERYSIETRLNTMVLKIEENNEVLCTSSTKGIEKIKGMKIILANGAKEESTQTITTTESRCAGIYTVGMAKKIFTMENKIIGRKILINGWNTLYMIEKELKRSNVEIVGIISDRQDINTYGLTKNIYYNHVILDIQGEGRIEKVTISNDYEDIEVDCDTILFAKPQLSNGLVSMKSGIKLNPNTTGPEVNNEYMTSKKGVYACGNGIYIHKYIEEIERESILLIKGILNNKDDK